MKRTTIRRPRRGRPGELVCRHQPSTPRFDSRCVVMSPHVPNALRVAEDGLEACAVEGRAAQAYTDAIAVRERTVAAVIYAHDAGDFAKADSLMFPVRQAEDALRLRKAEHAACRHARSRLEGQALYLGRYA